MLDEKEAASQLSTYETFFLRTQSSWGSVEEFTSWVAQNHGKFSSNNQIIGLSNPPVAKLIDRLSEPWIKLQERTESFNAALGKNENTAIAELKNINELLVAISDGSSYSNTSTLSALVEQSGNNEFTRWGILSSVFNTYFENAEDSPIPYLNQPQRSDYCIGATVGQQIQVSQGLDVRIDFELFGGRAQELRRVAQSYEGHLRDLEEEYAGSIRKIAQERSDFDARLTSYIRRKIQQYVSTVDSHKDEMERIRTTYNDLLSLKDAATHWKTRAENNRTIAYAALAAFFLVAAGALTLLFSFGPIAFENFLSIADKYKIQPSPLLFLAFASVPSAIFLWAVRFPSKLFSEHLKISNDARFRHTLITTYLSLLRDNANPVRADERHFALKSIFSQFESSGPDDQLNINLHDLLSQRSTNP